MGHGNTTLERAAEEIFTDLGYAVSSEGGELRAKRKWRVVQVTPMAEPSAPPAAGELRCFVTWESDADALERRLQRENPDYEWAIIGVKNEDYVVSRGPT